MRSRYIGMMGVCLGFALSATAGELLDQPVVGKVPVQSVQVMSFAPEGVLLIGDGKAAAVIAVDTGDTKAAAGPIPNVTNIQQLLADRLGTTADGVEIVDLAVNPASQRVYLAVSHKASSTPVIMTLGTNGKLEEFAMDNRPHASVALTTGSKAPISKVTDVAWADGRVIAAGQSNEAFASKIFVIPAPMSHQGEAEAYSAETYHVAHKRWETKAPMSVLVPYTEAGVPYVVGAFACTPVVKYPISSLQPGAQVKGLSMIELGNGNRPIDMFLYERGTKEYVLSNTFRFHHDRKPVGPSPYWTVKFESSMLADPDKVNEKATHRLVNGEPADNGITVVESFHGVTQMAKLDNERAVVLRQREQGGPVDLEVVALP